MISNIYLEGHGSTHDLCDGLGALNCPRLTLAILKIHFIETDSKDKIKRLYHFGDLKLQGSNVEL